MSFSAAATPLTEISLFAAGEKRGKKRDPESSKKKKRGQKNPIFYIYGILIYTHTIIIYILVYIYYYIYVYHGG